MKSFWLWLRWQMKSAGEKAHILQIAHDPAYQAWFYNYTKTREDRYRAYLKLMDSKPPKEPDS